jgi:hypothetical protein
MSRASRFELLCGWLAALLASAVAVFIRYGGYIAPASTALDLIILGVLLAALALGVTLDVERDSRTGRLLLALATALFAVNIAISRSTLLLLPLLLALTATTLAFTRPHARGAST